MQHIINGSARPAGTLAVKSSNSTISAPLAWKLRNALRPVFIGGFIANRMARAFTWFTGAVLGCRIVTITSELAIKVRRFSSEIERETYRRIREAQGVEAAEQYARFKTYWEDYGTVAYAVVTDAGVAYIVDDFDNAAGSADVSLFNFHGMGTTNTAEAVGDTALAAESTTALNPDSTRATGTRSQPAANQYRSVGTLTADAPIAAVEHGLFTTSGTGTGTLLDRSVFSTVNLASAESIQFTYTITVNSGG